MKFCQQCGLENTDEASLCTGCGTALAGSGKTTKRSMEPLKRHQEPPGAAGLLFDPASWRARSTRPLRAAPGARRHYLVPPIGDPIRLDPKGGPTVLGRDDECDIAISSAKVSRRHLEITFDEDRAIVKDLGTMNGTLVNDRVLADPMELRDGDQVKFGDVTATYRLLEAGDPETKLHQVSSTQKTNATVSMKNVLGGDLAMVPIQDLLGQLARAKASGVLVVESADASITFFEGTPTEMRLGDKKGTAALQGLQRLTTGAFRFDPK